MGWGLSPKTWQGWVYVAVMIAPFVVLTNVGTKIDAQWVNGLMIVWGVVFGIDLISIMIRVPKDEREALHEALSERNALWAMLIVLVAGAGYQAAASYVNGEYEVDPFLIAAIIAATLTKSVSNLYLDKKG